MKVTTCKEYFVDPTSNDQYSINCGILICIRYPCNMWHCQILDKLGTKSPNYGSIILGLIYLILYPYVGVRFDLDFKVIIIPCCKSSHIQK